MNLSIIEALQFDETTQIRNKLQHTQVEITFFVAVSALNNAKFPANFVGSATFSIFK